MEKMQEKTRKVVIAGISKLLILIFAVSIIFIVNSSAGVSELEDSMRFKYEYEALNSEKNEDGTNRYSYLSINEDNNVVYLSYEELLDFSNYGTGMLYFGRPACPWCRLLIPYMLEFADSSGTFIYYYNIEEDREANNERYKSILSIFSEHLPTDTVNQSEDDHDFDPGLKRVILPQLFYLKNGAVSADLMMFQHEYLADGRSEKVTQLLNDMHNSALHVSGNNEYSDDCECD